MKKSTGLSFHSAAPRLRSWVLQQSCPQVVAGSVDDRLQVMVHGHQLWWRTAAGLRLRRQRLPQHNFEALRSKRQRSDIEKSRTRRWYKVTLV